MIENKFLSEYLIMREEEGFEEKYERIIRENFRADF